jgi:hypothetical protein
MSRLRIWHLMFATVAAGVLFAAYSLDDGCSGLSALATIAYICAGLASFWGRDSGRTLRKRLLLGLLLGPFGVIIAWSKIAPDEWPERYGPGASDRRSPLLLKE